MIHATELDDNNNEVGQLCCDGLEVHGDGQSVYDLNDAIQTRLGPFTRKDRDRFVLAAALFRGEYKIDGMHREQALSAWKADQRPPEPIDG